MHCVIVSTVCLCVVCDLLCDVVCDALCVFVCELCNAFACLVRGFLCDVAWCVC